MKTKSVIQLVVLGAILFFAVIVVSQVITMSNREVVLRTNFEQKIDQRKSFFDKMYKILNQKNQVAVKNDSSFRKNVEIIMEGRSDSEGLFMKWVQETNPNANYSEVSALYKDLSRAIEAQREGFFNEEKVIQDIVREHKNLLRTFPTGFILKTFLGREEFVYTPISSTFTEQVFKTGKEDNIDLF